MDGLLSIDFLIPFFFIFAIVYGALEISGVFKNKAVKAIIALALGFFAVSNADVVAFIHLVLPYAAIFFVVVFFIGFIAKPFKRKAGEPGRRDPFLLLVVLGLLLIIFAQLATPSSPFYPDISSTILGDETVLWGIGIVIVIFMFYYAYSQSRQQQ
ncbi:MAG: hypothetical protein GTN38_03245 [Candidatus Aenigmarchaeota archaeon]|nr:hypothetical protein [Candidatus Aenigmarchaeota archaeon]NIP40677.1 hypothetical protein [Candidatus Aenigmarchaeota archaeon]NIQ18483.1 hypothetical protein [Candidatus Aenigmarchaeota archaeon]NIS73382.1 hypothetical protein [Candidatus Aenigmarchaeota archaeon]